VLLKSTGHHNTGTRSEEVEEELMTTTRAQEQQPRTTAQVQTKSGMNVFLVPYCSLSGNVKPPRGVVKNRQQETKTAALFFSFFGFLIFTQQNRAK
jgi:hypothetical protein